MIVALLIMASFVAGCISLRLTDYTILNNKNFTVPKNVQLGERVRGEDCKVSFLFFVGIPNLKEAIDEAIEKGRGDILIDAVIYEKTTNYFLFIKHCYIVEGTVGKTW